MHEVLLPEPQLTLPLLLARLNSLLWLRSRGHSTLSTRYEQVTLWRSDVKELVVREIRASQTGGAGSVLCRLWPRFFPGPNVNWGAVAENVVKFSCDPVLERCLEVGETGLERGATAADGSAGRTLSKKGWCCITRADGRLRGSWFLEKQRNERNILRKWRG